MTLLDRVVTLLGAHQVSHALIGAAAMAARGIARSTFDIALLTTDDRVLHAWFWNDLQADGISIDVRRGDDDDPLGGVVRIEAALERPVDVILGKHAWQARVVERADRPPGGPPVVTSSDLILLKLHAGGTQDLWDIRELLRLPDSDRLMDEVSDGLSGLPDSMRALWTGIQS